ncbi:Perchlorate reductase subunit gamma precursor [Rubripirellula lacrimiformis]|uniref:Perchlorate reductase subunit gamma n=1 Tax=Rubripirellula lacrimiformis TaxID=1930273 RepID=A0A517N418_9BACT|nr:cytochrome c family protein [Rubripirellula lacrimiformis]QDT01890.1 Perchlorate reductase subunit gamma precursor [Rubripirellula lacrimiformis]
MLKPYFCTLATFVIVLAMASDVVAKTFSASADSSPAIAAPPDPASVLGNESCVKCHASEIQVWKNTPHAKTFDELHRRPEAKQIASKLGLQSIKNEGRCVACHYTQQAQPGGSPHVMAGVSCESCHGAAKHWVDVHQDYGGEGITRLSETPEHRMARIAKSVSAGMRNPANVYAVAQSCLRCHTTADEQLVNVGGHSPGSLDFEFVSWSQGTIRHNFVRSDGKSNDVSDPKRIRVMFVAGMIAELESSLRATAVATEKATYGVTVAKRGARAGARLKSVAAKINSPTLDQVVAVFAGVTLKLNNKAELIQAADRVAELGYRFAEITDGATLESLDTFIPSAKRYK